MILFKPFDLILLLVIVADLLPVFLIVLVRFYRFCPFDCFMYV